MIIYIDIDETICSHPYMEQTRDDIGDVLTRNYAYAEPIVENIEKANKLYDEGHKIVYWTARGHQTGIDWRELTEKQFEKWGVKYHELKFNKPYDLIIDDKALNAKDW